MKMVRAADFINAMSVVPGHVISDIDLSCACPVCGEVQRLSDAIRHHPDDSHIVYRCRNAHSDAEPLVEIAPAGEFADDESLPRRFHSKDRGRPRSGNHAFPIKVWLGCQGIFSMRPRNAENMLSSRWLYLNVYSSK